MAGAAAVAAVAALVWWARSRARTGEPGPLPGVRHGLVALVPLAAIAAAILLSTGATPTPAVAALDCATPPGHGRPAVGICRTSLGQLAAALATPRVAAAPVAGPSCAGADPVGYQDLTAAGLIRALRIDNVRSGILPAAAAADYARLAGGGAARYVTAVHAGSAPAILVAGLYRNGVEAEQAAEAVSHGVAVEYLTQLGVPAGTSIRVLRVGNATVFELTPSPRTRATALSREVVAAVNDCPITRVIRTPAGVDAAAHPAGASCGPVPGIPGGHGLTPAGLVRSLRSDRIAAEMWGPGASRTYGGLAGTGALGYVTSTTFGAVPATGLFVIGVYPSTQSARAAWNRTGRQRGVGARIARFNLPATSRFRSLNQIDNLVLFQLFRSTRLDEIVYDDMVDAGSACVT